MSDQPEAHELDYLRPFCLGNQEKQLDAIIEHGGCTQAARALGFNTRTVFRMLSKLKRRAVMKGLAPQNHMTKEVPEPLSIKRVSSHYGKDGELTNQWVIASPHREAVLRIITEKLDSMCEAIPAMPTIPKPRTHNNKDLLTLVTISDWHLGMYAWAEETGKDYDSDIAVKRMMDGVAQMIAGSPKSEKAIFCLLGDTLHYDGLESITPSHHHLLDSDTRFPKLVDMAVDVTIAAVGMMAQKFKEVHIICAEGNHDPGASSWLRKTMDVVFSKNPRITVDRDPLPFYAYLHGKIFLGFHHADKIRNLKHLPELFASDPKFRPMWGKAKYSYIHTGHLHKQGQVISEHGGAVIIQHPTLASREAYGARQGYVSFEMARAYTYHKTRGEVSSISVIPDAFSD